MRKYVLIVASLLFHILMYYCIHLIYLREISNIDESIENKRVFVRLQREQKEVVEEDQDRKNEDKGQIIEQAAKNKEKPKDSEHLAEEMNRTDRESQVREKNINPEVISDRNSEKEIVQFEEALDVQADQSSSGATTGVKKPLPKQNGPLISIPSQFQFTNKKGIASPTVASSLSKKQNGQVSNDLLDVEYGDIQSVNAQEYKYASYMNQIRRLVNFYWQQNLNNLQLHIPTDEYTTSLFVVITNSGEIHEVSIHQSSGIEELDHAIYSAFYLAAPFPEPPEPLVDNGRVLLPYFSFTLNLSPRRTEYSGVDPRAGVRYPGLLKNSDR
jgi:hypothetical protein